MRNPPIHAAVLLYQSGIANLYRADFGAELALVAQADFRTVECLARGLVLAGARVVVMSCNVAGSALSARASWAPGIGATPFRDAASPPEGAELGECPGPCVSFLMPGERCDECGRYAREDDAPELEPDSLKLERLTCSNTLELMLPRADELERCRCGHGPELHDLRPCRSCACLDLAPSTGPELDAAGNVPGCSDLACGGSCETGDGDHSPEPDPATLRAKTAATLRAAGICPNCGRRVWSRTDRTPSGWSCTGRHGEGCSDFVPEPPKGGEL